MSPTYSVCKNHGYLTGEQYTCPICGETTEVYSRITGYYRPVQNWNDGKAEEFKRRKLYNLEVSTTPHKGHTDAPAAETAAAPAAQSADGVYLFATKTCPNCKMAESFLNKAGVPFEKIYAEDNEAFAKEHGVKMAPTLIVAKDGNIEKITNVSNIRKYIDTIA